MKPPVNRCTWVLEQQNNNEEPLQYSGRERWNSMGIIKAAISSIGSGFADQWLEYIRAGKMDDRTVMSAGVAVRGRDRRNANTKGSADYISDGSLIEVGVNQCMLLVDGGRIVDFTTEPGYYKVDNQATPSAFSGSFSQALEESFDRLRFGGVPSRSQKAYFINLQEIKGIAFGTPTPINYFDSFYNAELYLRTNGYFSIRITDPIRFYAEAILHDRDMVTIEDIQKLYVAEFLTAFQTAVNRMSVDGIRISHVTSKAMELAKYMGEVLDESWKEKRGMSIESVGINSISYDEQSKKLIDMRNQGAMLSDPTIREGYVQGAVARGMEAAGSNRAGASVGFMNMNMGMQQGGGFVAAASRANQVQQNLEAQSRTADRQTDGWVCSCGAHNTGKFCTECGKPKADLSSWVCSCGTRNTGKFCMECGKPKPSGSVCPQCGWSGSTVRFCPECGAKLS